MTSSTQSTRRRANGSFLWRKGILLDPVIVPHQTPTRLGTKNVLSLRLHGALQTRGS